MALRNALENLAVSSKQDTILVSLASLLTELTQKLEPGGEVALDAPTLAALESITAVVSGTVALDSTTLAALESITVQNPGGASAVNIQDGGNSITVDATSLPLPMGAATETTLALRLSEADFDTKTGSLTETAPATDTASSGLNGRLQRIAQRLTSLIALLPAALVGGRLDANLGAWLGSTAPTVGQKTMAASLPVVIASDQSGGLFTDTQLRAFAAVLGVTATAAVGVAVTLTLPAAGAGLFHYITALQITASTAPVALGVLAFATVTTTNLNGAPVYAMLINRNGGSIDRDGMLARGVPLRSNVANTATTIVAPATANCIWRLNVEYYTGP